MKIKENFKTSRNKSYHKRFSHIYVEEEILDSKRTKQIIAKLPNSKIISVPNYKEIFNPSFQNFQVQKKSIKLILAKKKDNLLYKGSILAPNFGYENFYYNILIQNCIFNCAYCYLQGMYPSANIVVYVNLDDFFDSVKQKLNTEKPLYLCISYETDILALENLLGYTQEWINFATQHQNLILEIRTKSAFFKTISHLQPSPNIILAWSLSPDPISQEHENLAPTFQKRLKNIYEAVASGWSVRLCLDPVLYVENWEKYYLEMIREIFHKIPANKILDISVGTFRMNKKYLNHSRIRRNSYLLYFPFKNTDSVSSYPQEIQKKLTSTLKDELEKYVSKNKIFIV